MSVMIHIARQLLRAFGKDEWFITVSGKQVFILNPRVEAIDGQDIGHALCHICRFGGHTKKFYSVGQHSMFVHSIVENAFSEKAVEPIRGFFSPVTVATKKDIRTAFMHDSPEAYLGDVIRPLKTFLPVYKFIESLWWNVIAEKYALHQANACHGEVRRSGSPGDRTQRSHYAPPRSTTLARRQERSAAMARGDYTARTA